jgi:guanine deaminase
LASSAILIRGGRVYRHDGDPHLPAVADVLVEDDRIADVRPGLAAGAGVEVIEAAGKLVLPGFINAHYHSHDVLAKGTLEEVPLETWRLYALPPQYPPRPVEEVYARTLLGALECLRSGMTTVQDMLTLYPFDPAHFEAVLRAYDAIGIRVAFALQYGDKKGIDTVPFWRETFPPELHGQLSSAAEPEATFDLLGFVEREMLQAPARPRVIWALGPSSPERCTTPLMRRTVALARRYGAPVFAHIYESRGMAVQARLEYPEHGGSLIRRLAAEDALGPHLNLAHSVWLTEDEIRLLGESRTNVVLNPQSNLKLKNGIPPIRALQAAGVSVALGCDNCSCGDAQNMFQAMKLFGLLAAIGDQAPGPPQAVAALEAATRGGARALGKADTLGTIEPGYQADLTILTLADPSFVPLNSVARQLVFAEAGRAVETVLVDGKVVLRNGRLATMDEATIYAQVEAIMPGFRKDFSAIAARIATLQPYLAQAHRKIWDHPTGTPRMTPF